MPGKHRDVVSLFVLTLLLNGCCSTTEYPPPYSGLYSETTLGFRSLSPQPVTTLSSSVNGGFAWFPHSLHGTTMPITVAADATNIRVEVVVDTGWNMSVWAIPALGHAQIWLGLDMDVATLGGGAVQCRADHVEQENRSIVGGESISNRRPGPQVTLACNFTRSSGDPTQYQVSIFAAMNGTFVLAAGGSGSYDVTPGTVYVTTCPP